MNLEDAQASTSTIQGMVLVDDVSTHKLFDSGAMHSFVSSKFSGRLARCSKKIPLPFVVSGPSGQIFTACEVLKNCEV